MVLHKVFQDHSALLIKKYNCNTIQSTNILHYRHNLIRDIPSPLEKCEATDLRNTRLHILNWQKQFILAQ